MHTHKFVRLALATAILSPVILASECVVSQAADAPTPYRAPLLPPPPFYNWTGFYAGAHVGGGFFDDGGGSGFIGGGQVGYNYQINHWVLGLEAELSGTTIGGSGGATVAGPGMVISANASGGLDWVATLAPRVGYAFDRWLVYGKVGAAWAHSSATATTFFNGVPMASVSVDSTTSGAVFGVGTEYALRDNWTAKVEYNVFDFGSNSATLQTIKAGVNYRFHGF